MMYRLAHREVELCAARPPPNSWNAALAMLMSLGVLLLTGTEDAVGSSTVDPEDGQTDLSEWLVDRKGFLPVPIVITEPAVGYGGGIAAMFFRRSVAESTQPAQGGRVASPDIFGVAVAATENGSKGAAAGARLNFDQDRWRYRGSIGKVEVHLDFYGIGGALGTGDSKIGYSLDGMLSSHQILRRVGDSNHFIGARWNYLDLQSELDPSRPRPRLPEHAFAMRNSGLGLAWEYDSRDNIFTPSRGWNGSLDAMFYARALGSDNEYRTYRAHAFGYLPVPAHPLVLGVRLDARAARGDVPFYQLPFVDMRGISAARYQDKNTAIVETELRWNMTSRWALIGFIGAGRAWGERKSFAETGSAVSKGIGARYLIARRLGLYVGLDYAWGPEDQAFYIQVGSAWR